MSKRMVFIQNTRTIPDKTGSTIKVRTSSVNIPDLLIPGDQKVQMYSFPLELKTLEARDFHLSFAASKELVAAGVMLVGAYHEDGNVRAAFINFGKDFRLKEKQVVLEVSLTEAVRFFQSDLSVLAAPSSAAATQASDPKKSSPRKKKQ